MEKNICEFLLRVLITYSITKGQCAWLLDIFHFVFAKSTRLAPPPPVFLVSAQTLYGVSYNASR